jgi:plasmid stabilization system protein ParE
MAARVSISDRAEADLANQYRWYAENASNEMAETFLNAFDEAVDTLSRFPKLGRLRQFRARELSGVRSLALPRPFDVHLVFYKTTEKRLTIERVMHGARDLPLRLKE